MAEEKKDKIGLIIGVLAVAGVAAYFLLRKPGPAPPPPGEVAMDITYLVVDVK